MSSARANSTKLAVASTDASLVLFDHDLTPSQLRTIEARLPCHVIDRSQLILDIFARYAKTLDQLELTSEQRDDRQV